MIRSNLHLAILAAGILLAPNLHAGSLGDCARIGNDIERLRCFDRLAAEHANRDNPPPAAAAEAEATLPPPIDASPAVATQAAAPALTAPENFGFELESTRNDDHVVVSRYDGEFTGWSGNTIFRLENGQVWKQSQSGRVVHRRSRPEITIRRASFGSFRLKVEGLNRTIKVKRIK